MSEKGTPGAPSAAVPPEAGARGCGVALVAGAVVLIAALIAWTYRATRLDHCGPSDLFLPEALWLVGLVGGGLLLVLAARIDERRRELLWLPCMAALMLLGAVGVAGARFLAMAHLQDGFTRTRRAAEQIIRSLEVYRETEGAYPPDSLREDLPVLPGLPTGQTSERIRYRLMEPSRFAIFYTFGWRSFSYDSASQEWHEQVY